MHQKPQREMSTHRRRPSSPATAPPLEDEDMLAEILLRLPPEPSSLPRASAVCKSWRHLVSDPRFARRFRLHHRRNPPILGFFHTYYRISFLPTLEAPNRVAPGRFSLQQDRGDELLPFGSRHGLVLLLDIERKQVLVWDPVTGRQDRIVVPPWFNVVEPQSSGAVFRAAGDEHFQVVLVRAATKDVLCCVYSSETGLWGNLISTRREFTGILADGIPVVLVGDSLYWTVIGMSPGILEFDLERQNLAVIRLPVDLELEDENESTVFRAEGGGLGFLFVSKLNAQLWKRKTDCDGVASWELAKTIELDKLLPLNSVEERRTIMVAGFAECNSAVILWTGIRHFMVLLELLQFKEVLQANRSGWCQPFESVYAAGT